MRSRWILTIAATAALTSAAWAAEAPKIETPAPAPEAVTSSVTLDLADACEELNYTPVELEVDPLDLSASAQGCKNCKDRTWCKCTYQGLPRVSCNPCCYGNLGQIQTCFD